MKSSKGSEFERSTCKLLSLWFSEGTSDSLFWRTSQSGGRATTRAKSNKLTTNSYGDVSFIDPIGQPLIDACLIELKCGYTNDINPLDLLDKKKGTSIIFDWWEKASKERVLAGRQYTILIFQRNRRHSCVAISKPMARKLSDWFGNNPSTIHVVADLELCIFRLKDFLDWISPEFFK